jgi:hypothetical protein
MSASATGEKDASLEAEIPGMKPLIPLRDQYIASPLFDWFFILASPLLAVAAVLGAAKMLPAVQIEYYVIGYMAVGHHVPTMLRAYGDPDEFGRNRFQFLAIPICVAPIVLGLTMLDSRLLTLIFVWDQYHFIRQHYGFMRIYDVKAGASSAFDMRLDQWLCYSFFACILTHSGFYGYMYADAFYNLGVSFPHWLVVGLENGSLLLAIVVGILYLARLQFRFASGLPIAKLKLVLFATSLGVWYYSYVILSDGFLSYAISSLFHCLQYDAFAWYYNRAKARTLTPTRSNAIFRLIHESRYFYFYVGAIGAYGLFSAFGKEISLVAILALNTTTGLIHYYFDSFIWRVSRSEFRKHL